MPRVAPGDGGSTRRSLEVLNRLRVDTSSIRESIVGYSRVVRFGDWMLVSGTTRDASSEVVCPGEPHGQIVYVLDMIAARLGALGGSLETWCAPGPVSVMQAGDTRMASASAWSGRHAGSGEPGRQLRDRGGDRLTQPACGGHGRSLGSRRAIQGDGKRQ